MPSSRATNSFTRGLYFMVQEPSGYMPRSIAKFQVESRVKWRRASISLTSGKPVTPSLRWFAPNVSEGSAAGTSNGGSSKARLPGEDFSKISPSLWLVCRDAFLIRSFKSVPVEQPILAVQFSLEANNQPRLRRQLAQTLRSSGPARVSVLQRLLQCAANSSGESLNVC